MPDPYADLESRFHRLAQVRDAEGVLHWDMAVMMPAGGATARAEQLAALKGLRHGLLTAPDMPGLLDRADGSSGTLDPWQRANLAEMRRLWTHATALTESQVEALSKAQSECETIWREARKTADFGLVLPSLEVLLSLVRETAEAKAGVLGLSPYDSLLDEYEPGGRAADIDPVFAELEAFLPDFLNSVLERQASNPPVLAPEGPFPVRDQRNLGRQLMQTIGFDFNHGRLDTSHHPFCGGVPDDVRITTRYDEADFSSALMGVLHETGHALYDRGLPKDRRGQPVGEPRSMAVHESQSLLIEMQVCRSPEFITFAAPLLRAAFSGAGPAWETDNLIALQTRVERGLIRVDADEITYPLHVILRYRLERAMIEGDLAPSDLPAAWNEGMEKLLGRVPGDDALGCLQDIHWFDGAWGYFPTYTLGAMMAAQLFDAAKKAEPSIPGGIEKGDFAPLISWLGEKVHARGSVTSSNDLIGEATGRALDATAFTDHLKRRYLG